MKQNGHSFLRYERKSLCANKPHGNQVGLSRSSRRGGRIPDQELPTTYNVMEYMKQQTMSVSLGFRQFYIPGLLKYSANIRNIRDVPRDRRGGAGAGSGLSTVRIGR